eukprot:CAMPEP_0113936288 /NCGR_PEP_ID=MMETSP1339-20121228/3229_1 /TAXON_ID=94617 /ORGANISM="Fibrocapsa japonica" /LENGTH=393 /DNA_ID=CAMNT_0000938703 /DNA_START=157 /DNA_END=1338 /DNA_ORIENTATION=+ /assembly_acc=CAM_ASM_000762
MVTREVVRPEGRVLRAVVHEGVGVVVPLQGEGAPVLAAGGLVEHHVPRGHRHVVGAAAVVVDVQVPGLLHVLVDVDDDGYGVGADAVHVAPQLRPLLVHPDAVAGRALQLVDPRPLLQVRPEAAEDLRLHAPVLGQVDHVGGGLEVVGVRVAVVPHLQGRVLLVGVVVSLDHFPHVRRGADFLKPHLCEVGDYAGVLLVVSNPLPVCRVLPAVNMVPVLHHPQPLLVPIRVLFASPLPLPVAVSPGVPLLALHHRHAAAPRLLQVGPDHAHPRVPKLARGEQAGGALLVDVEDVAQRGADPLQPARPQLHVLVLQPRVWVVPLHADGLVVAVEEAALYAAVLAQGQWPGLDEDGDPHPTLRPGCGGPLLHHHHVPATPARQGKGLSEGSGVTG